jgi:hypothetical protein
LGVDIGVKLPTTMFAIALRQAAANAHVFATIGSEVNASGDSARIGPSVRRPEGATRV